MPRRPLRPLTMAVSALLALTGLGSTAAATEIPVTGVVVAAPAPPRPSDEHIAAAGRRRDGREPPRTLSVAPLVGRGERPNVVVIMTDDARNDELRFMPNVRHFL